MMTLFAEDQPMNPDLDQFCKPFGPCDFEISIKGAPAIECHQKEAGGYQVAGAWMMLPGASKDRCLNVQAVNQGGTVQKYAGYRDGVVEGCDKMAITVMDDDSVQIQLVLSGEGDERSRVKTLSLLQLEQAVADYLAANPQPA